MTLVARQRPVQELLRDAGAELLDRQRFATPAAARFAVFDYIEGWYNTRRRHSALDYLSPIVYERSHGTDARTVASGSTIAPGSAMSVPHSVLVQ